MPYATVTNDRITLHSCQRHRNAWAFEWVNEIVRKPFLFKHLSRSRVFLDDVEIWQFTVNLKNENCAERAKIHLVATWLNFVIPMKRGFELKRLECDLDWRAITFYMSIWVKSRRNIRSSKIWVWNPVLLGRLYIGWGEISPPFLACYRLEYTDDVRRCVFAWTPGQLQARAFYLYA